jgi:DNA-binding beta-propeller fold protein YncE
MNPSRVTATLTVFAALVACAGASGNGASLPLKEVARVALPGPSNRFDYTSIDPTTNRLYIAHMNASQLLTFDLKSKKVVRTIDVAGVHGVIAVPELDRVFASATNDHEAVTIDAKTGRVVATAPAGSYPDGLVYDPVERHVFVSDEAGGVETVLNAKGARIATIALGGDAGNVQYDAGSRHVLVDVQTRDEVAVIDPRTNKLIRRIPVHCQSDHSLYVDSSRRLAFVACDGDAKLLTLDLRTMKVTQTADVGSNPDVLAFDTGNRRLSVSAESGDVAVFAEHAHRLTKLGQSHLASAAHTVAVDPRSHLVYFPLESGSNGKPQLLIMKPA